MLRRQSRGTTRSLPSFPAMTRLAAGSGYRFLIMNRGRVQHNLDPVPPSPATAGRCDPIRLRRAAGAAICGTPGKQAPLR